MVEAEFHAVFGLGGVCPQSILNIFDEFVVVALRFILVCLLLLDVLIFLVSTKVLVEKEALDDRRVALVLHDVDFGRQFLLLLNNLVLHVGLRPVQALLVNVQDLLLLDHLL